MSDFAENLRRLRKEKNLRQEDLGEELGLAQTTIASYEQNNRFPNRQTLIKIADYFNVSLDFLMGRTDNKVKKKFKWDINQKINLSPQARQVFQLLLEGNTNQVYQLLVSTLDKNNKITDIYINILEPVLKYTGTLWKTNKLEIFQEHLITNQILTIISRLKDNYNINNNSKDKTAISLTAYGEKHHVGIKMFTNLLEIRGWNTFYLGLNTPTKSVINAIKNYKADLLALSVTMEYNLNSASQLINSVKEENLGKKIKVIVGGAVFKKHDWKKTRADNYADNIREGVEIAENFVR